MCVCVVRDTSVGRNKKKYRKSRNTLYMDTYIHTYIIMHTHIYTHTQISIYICLCVYIRTFNLCANDSSITYDP